MPLYGSPGKALQKLYLKTSPVYEYLWFIAFTVKVLKIFLWLHAKARQKIWSSFKKQQIKTTAFDKMPK